MNAPTFDYAVATRTADGVRVYLERRRTDDGVTFAVTPVDAGGPWTTIKRTAAELTDVSEFVPSTEAAFAIAFPS